MHKPVLNVLAISICRAHRVFERNPSCTIGQTVPPLKDTTNQLKKPKTRLSGTNLRQSPVNLVRALLLLRFCGNSPRQLGFYWISIKANTIFEFQSSFKDSNLRSRTESCSKKIPPPVGLMGSFGLYLQVGFSKASTNVHTQEGVGRSVAVDSRCCRSSWTGFRALGLREHVPYPRA